MGFSFGWCLSLCYSRSLCSLPLLNAKMSTSTNSSTISTTPSSTSIRSQVLLHLNPKKPRFNSSLAHSNFASISEGYNQKQLLFHGGNCLWRLRCPKLQRSQHQEGRRHWHGYAQAHWGDLPQTQEARRRLEHLWNGMEMVTIIQEEQHNQARATTQVFRRI